MKLAATSLPAALMNPAHSIQPSGGAGSTKALEAFRVEPSGLQSVREPAEHGGATQLPLSQPSPGRHCRPQIPQFCRSTDLFASHPLEKALSQSVKASSQASPQTVELQPAFACLPPGGEGHCLPLQSTSGS
jgi:hypothetical protein